MFHSNQTFDITCEPDKLAGVIDFGIRSYNDDADMFTRSDGRVSMAVSRPARNIYAIGTGSMEPYTIGPNKGYGHGTPAGWQDMPFGYDPGIMARIACQWLDNHEPEAPRPDIDGTVRKGFRVMSVHSAWQRLHQLHDAAGGSLDDAILILEPCWLEYHK